MILAVLRARSIEVAPVRQIGSEHRISKKPPFFKRRAVLKFSELCTKFQTVSRYGIAFDMGDKNKVRVMLWNGTLTERKGIDIQVSMFVDAFIQPAKG